MCFIYNNCFLIILYLFHILLIVYLNFSFYYEYDYAVLFLFKTVLNLIIDILLLSAQDGYTPLDFWICNPF